jgi:hypothetical protein
VTRRARRAAATGSDHRRRRARAAGRWITAEENVGKRLSPFHGKWAKVVEFDTKVAELEMRQGEIGAELQELHQRALAAPAAHQQALAE